MSTTTSETAPPLIRDLPTGERPRERLERNGAAALATAELLAIVLGTGRQGASALDVAHHLLAAFGLRGLARATTEELCDVPGCGPAKAIRLKAALALGRRLAAAGPSDAPCVNSPGEAAAIFQSEMGLLEQEHLRVLLLNVKHHVLGVHEVYKGSVSASPVRVAEVFREPIRRNSAAIVVAHNHPSGDPAPSAEDIHVTRQLVEAGRLLDIEVLDHIIVGHQRWVSMRERGLGFG